MDRTSTERQASSRAGLWITAAAAFATYFCMYGFRKPFAAATFEGEELWGNALKATLVIAQLVGYMLSKVIGIKVISEMRPERRAAGIVALIVIAEAALVGFAVVPMPLKPVMMLANGLPLGMVFGLVLGYLEGRRQTEALTAALCASFILSSGVVKSVGRWLIESAGVSEFTMPMLAGAIFFPPLLLAVWVLKQSPPPDSGDLAARHERKTMDRADRWQFWRAYWPGLSLMMIVYVGLSAVRQIRDDYGVEIWRAMGVSGQPVIFTQSETIVAIVVTALSAALIWISTNLTALRVSVAIMLASFAVVAGAAWLIERGVVSPFVFMVACGVGLYVPYVAFHTTVFERFIAITRRPANLGFLMYLADSLGYLGYVLVLWSTMSMNVADHVLPFFKSLLLVVAGVSIMALAAVMVYLRRRLAPPAMLAVTDKISSPETPSELAGEPLATSGMILERNHIE